MDTPTQSSSKQKKYLIIQNFSLAYSIIELRERDWVEISGPYLTKEEAEVDLRNIICEQE